MSTLAWIAIGAVGFVALMWLIVSFSSPGRGRSICEWLGATGMFVALSCFFANLFLRSQEAGSLAGLIAFGFLGTIFSIGLLVSLFKLLGAMRGSSSTNLSATN